MSLCCNGSHCSASSHVRSYRYDLALRVYCNAASPFGLHDSRRRQIQSGRCLRCARGSGERRSEHQGFGPDAARRDPPDRPEGTRSVPGIARERGFAKPKTGFEIVLLVRRSPRSARAGAAFLISRIIACPRPARDDAVSRRDHVTTPRTPCPARHSPTVRLQGRPPLHIMGTVAGAAPDSKSSGSYLGPKRHSASTSSGSVVPA